MTTKIVIDDTWLSPMTLADFAQNHTRQSRFSVQDLPQPIQG